MNTKEKTDNELIAEFMGLEKNEQGFWTGNLYKLTYDTNWNAMMPVVVKIERTRPGWECIIENNRCCIKSYPKGERYFVGCVGDKLGSTHQAVTEFIKWYRSQPEGSTVNMK